jgi:predicted metal-binding membrane protein
MMARAGAEGVDAYARGTPATARTHERTAFRVLIAALSLAAWGALWLWSASPWSRFMTHGGWLDSAEVAALCRALPQGGTWIPALLHALAWALMITAMMLPTTLPILELFRRIVAGRADARGLVARVVAGYAIAWLGFGLVAHGADALLHAWAERSAWLAAHEWVVGAGLLAAAGAFQFSALKYRCLEKCHTPFGFINQRWRGIAPKREALRLGLDHGLFCIGCCWALMLLMFVVGTGSIAWMLVLGALMAAEKNLPWGRRLSAPVGAALLAWAGAVAALNLAG